jgi:Tfp pilus assembly protein PilX
VITTARPSREAGFAFPVTLFALTVLALLTAALAGVTSAELESGRLGEWDRRALYAAEAGVEHQLFQLKRNRMAGPVGSVSLGGSPVEARYVAGLAPASPGGLCAADPGADESWWEVTSRGQLWQGANLVHERRVAALVEIRYALLVPLQVTICRWSLD